MDKTMSDRYQYQSRPIKLCRWLKFMPLAYLKASWYTTFWFLRGCPIEESVCEYPTCRAMIVHIYEMCIAEAQMKMKYYYTIEEIRAGYTLGSNDDRH